MKLPVRFDRILFLRSPGASSLVRATVQDYGDEFVQGKLWLYDEAGKPCVLVDGFRAISLTGARRSSASGSREILYHVGWERMPASSRPSLQEPVSLTRLRDVAREALEQVIASRGRDKLQASMAACDELAAAQLARGLREMCSHGGSNEILTASSLRVAETMQPVFERLLAGLARRGLLEKSPHRLPALPQRLKLRRILRTRSCDGLLPTILVISRRACSALRTAPNSAPCCVVKKRRFRSSLRERERSCWINSMVMDFSQANGLPR